MYCTCAWEVPAAHNSFTGCYITAEHNYPLVTQRQFTCAVRISSLLFNYIYRSFEPHAADYYPWNSRHLRLDYESCKSWLNTTSHKRTTTSLSNSFNTFSLTVVLGPQSRYLPNVHHLLCSILLIRLLPWSLSPVMSLSLQYVAPEVIFLCCFPSLSHRNLETIHQITIVKKGYYPSSLLLVVLFVLWGVLVALCYALEMWCKLQNHAEVGVEDTAPRDGAVEMDRK